VQGQNGARARAGCQASGSARGQGRDGAHALVGSQSSDDGVCAGAGGRVNVGEVEMCAVTGARWGGGGGA
jgi:hypothetical protein